MTRMLRVDRKVENRVKPKKKIPIKIVEATASGTLLTLTFDQTVTLSGTPKFMTDVATAEPVSAVLSEPNTLKITYSEAIDAAEELTIPFEDPSVRNKVGGFVADSTFPLAA